MRTPPTLSDGHIITCLYDTYGLHITQANFLPIGTDVNTAVYRVRTHDGTPYFLKARRGNFDEAAVTVPAFLHHIQGIPAIMFPLPTASHQFWVRAHGFHWLLYPFIEGTNGFERALSDPQWMTFGATLHAIHRTVLPPALFRRVPQENYSPRWRNMVRLFHAQVGQRTHDDPIARQFVTFWHTRYHDIETLVDRAEQLSHVLAGRAVTFVVCHAAMHAGNVVASANDALSIVDWDTLLLAPKERDLMFVGGGVGGVWNDLQEEALFYQEYGVADIDHTALSYYRYERIVVDIAAACKQILGIQGSEEDRMEGLQQMISQFLPNNVVDIAHRTYQQIP